MKKIYTLVLQKSPISFGRTTLNELGSIDSAGKDIQMFLDHDFPQDKIWLNQPNFIMS